MKNTAPWIVALLLGLSLVGFILYFQDMLHQKDAEILSLNQKYNSLLADSNQKIATANSQLHSLATEANEKLAVANLPQVTVSVSFRKALLSSGNVAVIRNTSGDSIPASLTASRPSTGQQREFNIVFDGGQVKEIGEREGWAFLPGDTVQVSQPSHKSLIVTLSN